MFADRDSGRLSSARVKQPWPPDRPFKILSLDGGGIRGIFSASVIAELAKIVPVGTHVGEYFDLISGTSTGGIIALGLGLRLEPDRVLNLYLKRGKEIFPPFWTRHPWLAKAKQIFGPLHDHEVLKDALHSEFGHRPIGESETRLLIPAFVGPDVQVAVFKTDHHGDYRRDWQTPAWEVARATAAAPTYLPGHRYNLEFFLDGGVWANNPIMLSIVEAISAYDVRLGQIRVISIGTGNPRPHLKQSAVRAGFWGWREIISTAMYLTTDTALSQARLLLGADNIIRIEPSPDGAKILLDDWRAANEVMPSEAKVALHHKTADVMPFFETKALPRERHYTSGP